MICTSKSDGSKGPGEVCEVPVECEKDGNRDHVDGTVIHFAQLHVWVGWVVTALDTKIRRDGQRRTFFTTLYDRYPRRAVAGISKVAWEAVKVVNAAELDTDGIKGEEERAVCTTLE